MYDPLRSDYVSPLRKLAAAAGLTSTLARRLLHGLSSPDLRKLEKQVLGLVQMPDGHPIQLMDYLLHNWGSGVLHTFNAEPETPIFFTPTVMIATVLAAQLYVYTDSASRILVPDTRLDELKALNHDPRLIYAVNPFRLEGLMAFLYELLGFITAPTKKSGDAGADVLVWHPSGMNEPPLRAIQVKRWDVDQKIGIEEVQRMKGVLIDFNASSGEIITSSYFTDPARKSAATGEITITLTDFAELQRKIQAVLHSTVDRT